MAWFSDYRKRRDQEKEVHRLLKSDEFELK